MFFILLYFNKIKEANNKIQEANNKIQEANNKIQKANDIIQKTNDIIQKTNDIIQKTNDIIQKTNNINSREYLRFITCYLGANEIKSNHRIRKYFEVLDNFVPYANVTFCVSEYTKIDPIVIKHQNITINIERFGNQTDEELKKNIHIFLIIIILVD